MIKPCEERLDGMVVKRKKISACTRIILITIPAATALFTALFFMTNDYAAGFFAMLFMVFVNTSKHPELGCRLLVAFLSSLTCSVLSIFLGMPITLYSVFGLLFIICLTCAATSYTHGLFRKLKEQSLHSLQRLSATELVTSVNNRLLTERGLEKLQELTLFCVYEVSGNHSVLYTPDGQGLSLKYKYPPGLLLYPSESEAAATAYEMGIPAGYGTDHCAYTSFRHIPLFSNREVIAVVSILFDPKNRKNDEMIGILDQIMVRAAVAMERQQLADEQQKITMEKEAERIRSDFLRAISHDFRTPLTGIIGACSALTCDETRLNEKEKKSMMVDIQEEAAWLLRMVENLLSATRVGTEGPKLAKSLEPIEEIVSEALNRSFRRFPNLEIHTDLPQEFIMVSVDSTLIVQVLMNLIENAVKYSDRQKRVDISVKQEQGQVTFAVCDYGRGLLAEELDHLFQPATRKKGDFGHGLGLGLSICKSIISAHGGTIEGRNNESRGATFWFTLPNEEAHEH